jgi:hypothetical protein
MTTKQKLENKNMPKKSKSRKLALKLPKTKTLKFIEVSDLVPDSLLDDDFWNRVEEDAPFSWGDNNRTLVTAERFADHCEDRMEDLLDESNLFFVQEARDFIEVLRRLGQTYIDLEN